MHRSLCCVLCCLCFRCASANSAACANRCKQCVGGGGASHVHGSLVHFVMVLPRSIHRARNAKHMRVTRCNQLHMQGVGFICKNGEFNHCPNNRPTITLKHSSSKLISYDLTSKNAFKTADPYGVFLYSVPLFMDTFIVQT